MTWQLANDVFDTGFCYGTKPALEEGDAYLRFEIEICKPEISMKIKMEADGRIHEKDHYNWVFDIYNNDELTLVVYDRPNIWRAIPIESSNVFNLNDVGTLSMKG